MNLRKAAFDDHWRRVFARSYPVRLEDVTYKNLLCLSDSQLQIPKGICAVVGGNGVGKSALLAAISELLADPEVPLGVGHKARLKESELEGTATEPTGRKSLSISEDVNGLRTAGPAKFESEFYWLEPSYLVNLTHKQVNEDAEFQDLLEPLSPNKLDADELEALSYLLGKKFDSCDIYEITEYGGLDPFPYFVAEAGDTSYGSERMGFGELSLLFILWKLRTIKKNSVLVLEEPEAHVSPRSQRALMNILAKACDEKGLSVILTTHSPAIIANLPKEQLILLSKDAAGTKAVVGASKLQVNELLGATTQKRGMLLVEDKAASEFVIALFSELHFELLSQLDVVDAGGEAKINAALTSLPKARGAWLSVIGLYDGDMRQTLQPQLFKWPHLFLPGTVAPERLLRDELIRRNDGVTLLSEQLRREEGAVRMALDAVTGQDAHDWFTMLPPLVGCEHSALMAALVRIWLINNRATADAFINELLVKVDVVR